jgi:quinol-cytochrome oxidoreductase complex cytochrome b subunit
MKINELDKKHLEEKYSALRYSSEQFDKNVLYIASGALGISFAFIEKIVELKYAVCKGYLFASWYLFATVIFVSMVSHFVSIRVISWSIRNHVYQDESEEVLKTYTTKQQKQSRWIKSLNLFMMVGLVCGIISFIMFINYNLNMTKETNNPRPVQVPTEPRPGERGLDIPPPPPKAPEKPKK